MSPEAVDRLLGRRTLGRSYPSLDALAADLSPSGRASLLARYADLARSTTLGAPQLVVTAQGWVEGQLPRATIEVVVVPLPERVVLQRRRVTPAPPLKGKAVPGWVALEAERLFRKNGSPLVTDGVIVPLGKDAAALWAAAAPEPVVRAVLDGCAQAGLTVASL